MSAVYTPLTPCLTRQSAAATAQIPKASVPPFYQNTNDCSFLPWIAILPVDRLSHVSLAHVSGCFVHELSSLTLLRPSNSAAYHDSSNDLRSRASCLRHPGEGCRELCSVFSACSSCSRKSTSASPWRRGCSSGNSKEKLLFT